jgi:hypothetical protein
MKTTTNLERWGVMCEAAHRYDHQVSPRHISASRAKTQKHIPEMNRECASKSRHYLVKMDESGQWKEVK